MRAHARTRTHLCHRQWCTWRGTCTAAPVPQERVAAVLLHNTPSSIN